jgi:hypothetical protein
MAKAVTVKSVHKHLEAFQAIADAHDGNRGAGTSGHKASGMYVKSVLEKAGYDVTIQPFDFVYDEVVSTSLDEVSPEQRTVDHYPMSYSPSTPAGGVTAALAAPAGAATGCKSSDWAGFPAGSIALVSRGVCAFAAKSEMAKAHGAVAAIVYNNTDGALNGTLGGPGDDYAPITGVTQAEGQGWLAKMANGPVRVKFDLQKIVENRSTFNVIAETKAGRADNVVHQRQRQRLGGHPRDRRPAGQGQEAQQQGPLRLVERGGARPAGLGALRDRPAGARQEG